MKGGNARYHVISRWPSYPYSGMHPASTLQVHDFITHLIHSLATGPSHNSNYNANVADHFARELIIHSWKTMEIPSNPVTPQNTNPSHVVRRSFTAPPKSQRSPSSISAIREAGAEGAETLFAHHACRIVSFNLSSRVRRRHSSLANRGSKLSTEPVGILPWGSTTETTISTGVICQIHCEA